MDAVEGLLYLRECRMVEVDVWTGDVSSDHDFQLLLDGLELAATDAAAHDVVPSRAQRILNEL